MIVVTFIGAVTFALECVVNAQSAMLGTEK